MKKKRRGLTRRYKRTHPGSDDAPTDHAPTDHAPTDHALNDHALNDHSLNEAIRLHKCGELVAAERAYRLVLEKDPHAPQALYLCGVVTGQLGRPHEAIDLLRQAVSLQQDHLPALSQLAKLLQEVGQLEASAAVLRKLISMRPDLGQLYSNLGIVLLRLGEGEEAAVACGQGVELSPDQFEAHCNLGDVLKELRRFNEAAASYRSAIRLRPGATDVYRRLAAVLRNSGRLDEATEVLKQWADHEPGNPVVAHMIAAYSGQDTPARATDDYVRSVFDEFAATFDEDLRQLDYQVPRLIEEALSAEVGEGAGRFNILDAGCGTGLCGSLLRPLARRLVGVDLSPLMLQRARELNLYDDLVEGELVEYLSDHSQEFDIVVAADTFNYFGALEPLLSAAATALCENGRLIFTLERCITTPSLGSYQLSPSGRYRHQEEYVIKCMRDCGLTLSSLESAALRKEQDQSVTGIVVRARKPRN